MLHVTLGAVQVRSIGLDDGRIPRGRFTLQLTMRDARGGAVTSARALTIR